MSWTVRLVSVRLIYSFKYILCLTPSHPIRISYVTAKRHSRFTVCKKNILLTAVERNSLRISSLDAGDVVNSSAVAGVHDAATLQEAPGYLQDVSCVVNNY